MARDICREVMLELVTMVEAVSVTGKVMEQVINVTWERIKTETAWSSMENDPELMSFILTRIRMVEEAKVKEAEEKLQE